MDAVYLTLFVSSVLAALGVTLFVWLHGQKTSDHNLRLSLMPLDDDAAAPQPRASPSAAPLAARPPRAPLDDDAAAPQPRTSPSVASSSSLFASSAVSSTPASSRESS